ncbi:hypothetical protein [Sediminicola luteus]|uniref:HEPN domain-containing protein n=1 Tax=Sediminicola luteus TaxID=319238 RepID=A0A2A4G546_9FLAO|nr:hypothetical protein [Sediminicola luteus]PCE63108.1 hypothetical protein B7P33_17725 [Sediminicola luteus]
MNRINHHMGFPLPGYYRAHGNAVHWATPSEIQQLTGLRRLDRIFTRTVTMKTGTRTTELLLIMDTDIRDIAERVIPQIRDILNDNGQVSFNVLSSSYVKEQLREGNLYLLHNCLPEQLFYRNESNDHRWEYPTIGKAILSKEVVKTFEHEMNKITAYKKGAVFFQRNQLLDQAVFMAHQSFEQGYRLLEHLVFGKIKVCHSIEKHQAYVQRKMPNLKGTFDIKDKWEYALLRTLDSSYSDSRYSKGLRTNLGELDTILQKLRVFIEEIKGNFDSALTAFMGNERGQGKSNTKTNMDMETKNKNEDTDRLLEQIQKMTQDDFVLLKPIGGKVRGSYLNEAYVYGYKQLFDILRSTLNVCILALDEQIDLTLAIKRKEFDVQKVLEFAKNLIPMEEGDYLDKMRELLPDTKE